MTMTTETPEKTDTIAAMTRDELKALIREAIEEFFWGWEQTLPNPDERLESNPEVAEELRAATREKHRGRSLAEIMKEMELEE
jgi:hypothetical protein